MTHKSLCIVALNFQNSTYKSIFKVRRVYIQRSQDIVAEKQVVFTGKNV